MKKLVEFLVLALIVVSFVSCGENNNSSAKNDSSKTDNISSTKDEVQENKQNTSTAETVTLKQNDKYILTFAVPQDWRIATPKNNISDSCDFKKDTKYPNVGVSLFSNGGLTQTLSEMIESYRKIEMNVNPSTVEEAKEIKIGDFSVAYFLDNSRNKKFIAVASIDDNYHIYFVIDDYVPEGSESLIDMEKEMQNFFKNMKVNKLDE